VHARMAGTWAQQRRMQDFQSPACSQRRMHDKLPLPTMLSAAHAFDTFMSPHLLQLHACRLPHAACSGHAAMCNSLHAVKREAAATVPLRWPQHLRMPS
jgi:hypothetical protein